MKIHVVQKGNTLYGIAKAYNTTMGAIIAANELSHPNQLVTGQALVIPIPGSYYFVEPGDTLSKIAQMHGISYQDLARLNGISPNHVLTIGMRLFIPEKGNYNAEINAYVQPKGEKVSQLLIADTQRAARDLTYLAVFSFQIQRDGTLKVPLLDNFAQIASANKAALMMVITNFENGQFSADLGKLILNNNELQDRLLDNIIANAQKYNFKAVNFDLEFLPIDERENYNRFLRKAKERLSKASLIMSTALAPKTSKEQKGQWYEAHDYKAHGEIADFVIIMTYDWGWSGGPPMAISPINEVIKVLNYAITEIPASKIMLGQNLYGYDWTLPYVKGGPFAKTVSPQQAIDLARVYNQDIKFDNIAKAPYFDYTDNNGKRHKVWFEDANSIQAKFNLVKDYKLRGVSYWELGLSFPQNWLLIEDNFNVVKL